jgi:hypothetical protein
VASQPQAAPWLCSPLAFSLFNTEHSARRTVQGHARDLLLAGLTGHFAFHRNSAIPTVILGGDGSFHFAFHPEKDGNVRMAGLSTLQKIKISIL